MMDEHMVFLGETAAYWINIRRVFRRYMIKDGDHLQRILSERVTTAEADVMNAG